MITLQLEPMAEYNRPVGIGALVTVDIAVTVDVNAVAAAVRNCYDPSIKLHTAD